MNYVKELLERELLKEQRFLDMHSDTSKELNAITQEAYNRSVLIAKHRIPQIEKALKSIEFFK